jgi:hypothetical protein
LQAKLDASGYQYYIVKIAVVVNTTKGGSAQISQGLVLSPAIVVLELWSRN